MWVERTSYYADGHDDNNDGNHCALRYPTTAVPARSPLLGTRITTALGVDDADIVAGIDVLCIGHGVVVSGVPFASEVVYRLSGLLVEDEAMEGNRCKSDQLGLYRGPLVSK